MAKSKSVALLDRAVSLPGAGVTATALLINERATDREIGELGAALVAIEGARSFWLGDYGLFLQERKRKELVAELKAKRKAEGKPFGPDEEAEVESKGLHFMAGKAEALGIDHGNWRVCVLVARYFKPLVRTNISFGHHLVAIRGAGGVDSDYKKAVAWLLRAEENGWSVSKMREMVNKSLATATPAELPPMENPFDILDQADKWAHTAGIETIDSDGAKNLLSRFADLIKFIDKLKELAK